MVSKSAVAVALMLGGVAAGAGAQSRTERAAGDLARQVEEAARAVGTVAGALDRGGAELRYGGEERRAVDRCRPSVERYGRMTVERVAPSRYEWVIYGRTDPSLAPVSYYGTKGDRPRAFKCTVREDGRVKVKTKKLRTA